MKGVKAAATGIVLVGALCASYSLVSRELPALRISRIFAKLDHNADGSDAYAITCASQRAELQHAFELATELHATPDEFTSEADLLELVARMRQMSNESLRELTRARHRFRDSALITLLQDLSGPWVVASLGGLAVREPDPLMKAALVEGLAGVPRRARFKDVHVLPVLETLLTQYDSARSDPYEVAQDVVFSSYFACSAQSADYVRMTREVLARSDNRQLLIQGYFFFGASDAGCSELEGVVVNHAERSGRMGAIEGLRSATLRGLLSTDAVASTFERALSSERDLRNRRLIFDALAASRSERGYQVLQAAAFTPGNPDRGDALCFFAELSPASDALAMLTEGLAAPDMSILSRARVCGALAKLPDGQGATTLISFALDSRTPLTDRVASVSALEVCSDSESVQRELSNMFLEQDASELRAEALRVLAESGAGLPQLNLRDIARCDSDELVRKQAVELAAFETTTNVNDWLVDRITSESSDTVRAAALSALVSRCQYGDDSGDVLARLREFASSLDQSVGGQAIRHALETIESNNAGDAAIDLKQEASFYRDAAAYLESSDRRAAELEARKRTRRLASVELAKKH